MIRFFDTSALVKRYVEEPGSAMVRATLRAHPVTVARVTLAEAAAAVARACRLGAISEVQRDAIFGRLPQDFARLSVVDFVQRWWLGCPSWSCATRCVPTTPFSSRQP